MTKYQALCKIPRGRRKEGFGMELNDLFDVSACQHEDMNNCTCGIESKVPLNWQAFLTDQRGPRQSQALSERAQALGTGVRDYTR